MNIFVMVVATDIGMSGRSGAEIRAAQQHRPYRPDHPDGAHRRSFRTGNAPYPRRSQATPLAERTAQLVQDGAKRRQGNAL